MAQNRGKMRIRRRRREALQRFTVNANRAKRDTAYAVRKETERLALMRAMGV